MLKRLCILLLICIATGSFSQGSYNFPEKFDSIYWFNPQNAHRQLLAGEKDPERLKFAEAYAVNYIYGEQFSFDFNEIYMNWNEAEVYFLKLLDTVLGKDQKNGKLNIFLKRSTKANASASRYGNIYFNIGMLAEAENEAFLAGVIAHEAAHYIFRHRIKSLTKNEKTFQYNRIQRDHLDSYLRMGQSHELQADSFSAARLKRIRYDFSSVVRDHEGHDLEQSVYQNTHTYRNMLKASEMTEGMISKRKQKQYEPYDSHPSFIARFAYFKKQLEGCPDCRKLFVVDSAQFVKLKKIAREECKKIAFESGDFNTLIRLSFVDYLYGSKNLKNYYYLTESIRRLIYARPDLANTGFFTEYITDDELKGRGILYKPDYVFSSLKEYNDLKGHKLFKDPQKPFDSYQEALLYFSQEALKHNLNEANFTLALFYYSKGLQDSCTKYLANYQKKGAGLYMDFAAALDKYKNPKMKSGKTLLLYHNIANYTGFGIETGLAFNYRQCMNRKKGNSFVRSELMRDTSRMQILFTNEYPGAFPAKLNELKKLTGAVFQLYDDDDIEMCKKVRLKSHYSGEDAELSQRFKKQFLIFAPEWYTWFSQRGYDKLFLVDVLYQYKNFSTEEEFYNNYTGYYIDFNQQRPYFRDGVRNGFIRKQKEVEMLNELNSFLYE